MGRHGLKYCLLCNPDGNGTTGMDDTEAIGKYYLPKGEVEGQATHGWIPVCEHCAKNVEKYYEIKPIKGNENHEYFRKKKAKNQKGNYEHRWTKKNLVTQESNGSLKDTWKCEKCGKEKETTLGHPNTHGCPKPDDV